MNDKVITGKLEWSKTYNKSGYETYYKTYIKPDGIIPNMKECEEWKEYNSSGKIINYRDGKKLEQEYEYDDLGNMVHYRDSHEPEEWWMEYNLKNSVLH